MSTSAQPPSHRAILFNGPSNSGKTTLAHQLVNRLAQIQMHNRSITQPIRQMTATLLGIHLDAITYRTIKDQKMDLTKATIKQTMIAIGSAATDHYGSTFWVRRALLNCTTPGIYVFDDLGFQEELEYFKRCWGKENVFTIRLFRSECSFKGDIRSYVVATVPRCLSLSNNSSIEEAIDTILLHLSTLDWGLSFDD